MTDAAESGVAGSGSSLGGLIVPFYAAGNPEQRRALAVCQLGVATLALWILSLYFTWDDETGLLVRDPVNLWFNCIAMGAFAAMVFCASRPAHRTAGAVGICGLTVGMFYVIAENSFGMFTYNDASPGAGFWLGLASYVAQLATAGYAARVAGAEWCRGCCADRRPRSPWLVLGFAAASTGWIAARFLPTYEITVTRRPVNESGGALGEPLAPDVLHRDLVARLEGAQFIPELVGWLIFALAAPLAAWMLSRQLAAAFVSGFLVYFVADIAAALAVDYSLDYSQDLDNGLRITVDYGVGQGFVAQLATAALFAFGVAAICLTGSEHPAPASGAAADSPVEPSR
ncbi:MAG: hypothetical protein OXH20_13590 [bacterium]|nr:hypothetical protein [bacterium]MYB25378.1 hypothetical protein [Acidimicrobiia bacterium]